MHISCPAVYDEFCGGLLCYDDSGFSVTSISPAQLCMLRAVGGYCVMMIQDSLLQVIEPEYIMIYMCIIAEVLGNVCILLPGLLMP